MKNALILSLMLFVALSVGCNRDRAGDVEAAGEPAITSSELEQRVETQLNANPSLKDVSVDADADLNTVTLKGTVESEGQRESAMELARNAQPGVLVNNQIEVKSSEVSRSEYTEEHARSAREKAEKFGDKIGSSLDDAWIHTKITSKLIGDRDTSATEINVDVDANIVTLRGMVDTAAEKAEAERIARETEGVKSVRNQLRVK